VKEVNQEEIHEDGADKMNPEVLVKIAFCGLNMFLICCLFFHF